MIEIIIRTISHRASNNKQREWVTCTLYLKVYMMGMIRTPSVPLGKMMACTPSVPLGKMMACTPSVPLGKMMACTPSVPLEKMMACTPR